MKAYRVHGTTDDITTCGLCGRTDLKSTVIMIALDAAGNDLEAAYFGSDCAAKAAGWTQRDLKARINEAREAARREEERKRAAREAKEDAAFLAWVATKYGVTAASRGEAYDALTTAYKGRSTFSFLKEYRADMRA